MRLGFDFQVLGFSVRIFSVVQKGGSVARSSEKCLVDRIRSNYNIDTRNYKGRK